MRPRMFCIRRFVALARSGVVEHVGVESVQGRRRHHGEGRRSQRHIDVLEALNLAGCHPDDSGRRCYSVLAIRAIRRGRHNRRMSWQMWLVVAAVAWLALATILGVALARILTEAS